MLLLLSASNLVEDAGMIMLQLLGHRPAMNNDSLFSNSKTLTHMCRCCAPLSSALKVFLIVILRAAGRHRRKFRTYPAAMLMQIKVCVKLSRAAIRGAGNADMDAYTITGPHPAMKRTRCPTTSPSSNLTLLPLVV